MQGGGYGGPTGPGLVGQQGAVANQNVTDPMNAGGGVRTSSDTYSSIESILKGW